MKICLIIYIVSVPNPSHSDSIASSEHQREIEQKDKVGDQIDVDGKQVEDDCDIINSSSGMIFH